MAFRDWIARVIGGQAAGRLAADEDIAAVMGRNAESLMRMKGVLSVGIGHTSAGEPAIVVGVSDPRAASADDIPESIDGIPVIRHNIGRSEALGRE